MLIAGCGAVCAPTTGAVGGADTSTAAAADVLVGAAEAGWPGLATTLVAEAAWVCTPAVACCCTA